MRFSVYADEECIVGRHAHRLLSQLSVGLLDFLNHLIGLTSL